MFTAYLDESGTHDDSRVAVVAGYLATSLQWHAFELEWRRKILRKERIDVLHRSDLEHFKNDFENWTEDRRRAVIGTASELIRKRTAVGIGEAVLTKDFYQVMPPRFQKWVGGPYGWCAFHIISSATFWADKHKYRLPISYIFEAGAKGRRQVDHFFGELNSLPESRAEWHIGGWGFHRKAELVQLQSADTYAYELYKQMLNRMDGRPRPLRTSFALILRPSDLTTYWDGERLERWVKKYRRKGALKEFL